MQPQFLRLVANPQWELYLERMVHKRDVAVFLAEREHAIRRELLDVRANRVVFTRDGRALTLARPVA